jgi:hypothetical protein
VPINIKFIDRADYYTAFNEFNESGKTKTMENIIGKALVFFSPSTSRIIINID